MHAVVVRVTLNDVEAAQRELRERVVPRVAQAPGFVAGYWLEPVGGQGLSIAVFDSEDAARAASEQIRPPAAATLEGVEVREVVAHA